MPLHDAYGKQILPGDIILYPLPVADGSSAIFRFQVAAIDEWEWTEAARQWQMAEYGRADFPNFKLLVTEYAPEGAAEANPDLWESRFELAHPERAIVVSGMSFDKRHALPKKDRKGFWHKPARRNRNNPAPAGNG
jgi:hypothetical protein